jgi:hypothetical protein
MEYSLYDFYYRNEAQIKKEKRIATYPDTVGYTSESVEELHKIGMPVNQPIIDNKAYEYVEPFSADYKFNKDKNIAFYCKEDSAKVSVQYWDYLPMSSSDKGKYSKIANSEKYYYENMMQLRVIWTKLIESELFEIESKHLWEDETPVSVLKIK